MHLLKPARRQAPGVGVTGRRDLCRSRISRMTWTAATTTPPTLTTMPWEVIGYAQPVCESDWSALGREDVILFYGRWM